ncbi:MAG: hypothetical protein AABZ76_19315 [Pseudomonadota bacterium]|jgi:hypothetical protein|uniref:hypothetical protein n=1 Tax=Sphingobium yanoikuyae TaxID=13690 RepID=UPI001378D5F9|nr:hypothetical protein [Sphingobium yanoikuyae]NBB38907.1 hypothetical protein [Sphingobium yanoikuyae]
MQQILLKAFESVLLFAALFFTLPYIPSQDIERLPLLPSGAFAVILFASSRAIRWRLRWIIVVVEAAFFGTFVLIVNEVANLLYSL